MLIRGFPESRLSGCSQHVHHKKHVGFMPAASDIDPQLCVPRSSRCLLSRAPACAVTLQELSSAALGLLAATQPRDQLCAICLQNKTQVPPPPATPAPILLDEPSAPEELGLNRCRGWASWGIRAAQPAIAPQLPSKHNSYSTPGLPRNRLLRQGGVQLHTIMTVLERQPIHFASVYSLGKETDQ